VKNLYCRYWTGGGDKEVSGVNKSPPLDYTQLNSLRMLISSLSKICFDIIRPSTLRHSAGWCCSKALRVSYRMAQFESVLWYWV